MTKPVIPPSALMPCFDSGQRRILLGLADLILAESTKRLNARRLSQLADVNIPSPVDKDNLSYDSATQKWIARSVFTAVKDISATSYTAVLGDANSFLRFTAGTAVTFTIPPQSSVAWHNSAQIECVANGTGKVSVVGGAGVVIRKASFLNAASRTQYSVFGLKRTAENEWVLFGDLEIV